MHGLFLFLVFCPRSKAKNPQTCKLEILYKSINYAGNLTSVPNLLQWWWWNWSRVHKSIDDILRGLGHKYVKRFQFSSPFPNIQHRYTRVRVWQELIDFPWKYERKYLHFSLKFSQINSSKMSSVNFKSNFFMLRIILFK